MVTLATIRQDTFAAVRALIIANKPTYTHNGTVYTYTAVSAYPGSDGVFPCVAIGKPVVKSPNITMDALTRDSEIEVTLDFYAKEGHGNKAIDAGQDGLYNTFIGNIATFDSTNSIVPQDDFWFDVDSPPFMDNNQLIHTGSSIIKFRLK